MKRIRITGFWLSVAVVATLSLPVAVAADEEDDLEAARAGTAAYGDVAAAEADGYARPAEGPLKECIASLDNTGAMGFHYINGELVGDAVVDAAKPEALVYEPAGDGSLTLVAVEYVVFAEAWDAENDMAPMLFDQMFMLTDEPNRYELPSFYALHAWIGKENPSGLYANFNPNVTCSPIGAAPNTAVAAPAQSEPLVLIGFGAIAAAVAAWAVHSRRIRGRSVR